MIELLAFKYGLTIDVGSKVLWAGCNADETAVYILVEMKENRPKNHGKHYFSLNISIMWTKKQKE